jgi:hypothetical protein
MMMFFFFTGQVVILLSVPIFGEIGTGQEVVRTITVIHPLFMLDVYAAGTGRDHVPCEREEAVMPVYCVQCTKKRDR